MDGTKSLAAASLQWARKDGAPAAFPLDRDILLVGRDGEADIQIDDPLVSRAHARVERRAGRFFVIDLGSTNYTRVNGAVVGHQELQHGDEVTFGRTRCRFVREGALDPAAGA